MQARGNRAPPYWQRDQAGVSGQQLSSRDLLNVIHNPERPDLITRCANRTAGPGTAPQVEASVEEMVLTVKFHRYPTAGSSRSRRPATLAIITGPSLSNGLKLPRRARKRERARGQRY